MRSYEITIDDGIAPLKIFSSFNKWGVISSGTNLAALNIEFDIPVFRQAQPAGNAMLKIWGISLADISQAANYNGKNISIWGGMAKGLPLAHYAQYGPLLSGTINQCFGNWQDTNQTMDFVITSLVNGTNSPTNLSGVWKAGLSLGSNVVNTLKTIYPLMNVIDKSSPDIKLSADEPYAYENLTQYAQFVYEVSLVAKSNNPTYQGINISIRNNTFYIEDGSQVTTSIPIGLTDLIGQPTWHSLYTVQFKCVLRADINVGDYIKLPSAQQRLQAKVQSQLKQSSVFGGTMQVTQIRHVGNFRQPSGDAWCTIIDASIVPTT